MIVHHKKIDSKSRVTQAQKSSISQRVLKNITNSINKKDINILAQESNFIKRTSSKFTGFEFLTTMLVSSIDAESATLEKLSDIFRTQHRINIRAQSIMERLNDEHTVKFLKSIFENLLKNQFDSFTKDILPDLLSPFSKILIQDSTVCDLNPKLSSIFKGSGGRASKASLKLDVIYDFKTKRFEHITLTDNRDADQKLGCKILDHLIPNTLVIRDLGYLRMDSILKIISTGGFVLSRMKNNTCVYLNENDVEQLDLAKYLHENFRKASVVDIKVYITEKKIGMRLVAYKVPKEISEQRRRAAHAKAKKDGRTLSKKSLTLLDFSLFITNIPVEICPPEVIGTIYRIRWQIELMFKDWKSRLKIDCLCGKNQFRIKCLLYTRLVLILIINGIYKLFEQLGYQINKIVSIHKVYSWVKCSRRLIRIISGKFSWWEERYLDDIVKTCMSHQNRKRKTSLQAIFDREFYYSEAS